MQNFSTKKKAPKIRMYLLKKQGKQFFIVEFIYFETGECHEEQPQKQQLKFIKEEEKEETVKINI